MWEWESRDSKGSKRPAAQILSLDSSGFSSHFYSFTDAKLIEGMLILFATISTRMSFSYFLNIGLDSILLSQVNSSMKQSFTKCTTSSLLLHQLFGSRYSTSSIRKKNFCKTASFTRSALKENVSALKSSGSGSRSELFKHSSHSISVYIPKK